MHEIHLSHYLENQASKYRKRMLSAAAGGLAAAAVGIPLSQPAIAIAGMGMAAMTVKRQYRHYAKTLAGIEGENILRQCLNRRLDDAHTAIYNIPTGFGDIDCAVIGPGGIHIMEVKHMSGIIRHKNGVWTQTKNRCNEIVHIKSPAVQLIRNIRWLKKFLRRHNGAMRIQGSIVFTHPRVRLDVEDIRGIRVLKVDEMPADVTTTGISNVARRAA
ncbi:MAG TPA: hypothetical protein DDZ40_12535 [Deltaproteobacteria bacterium]|nr:hypothetical protein [Deltaproteobacteria bacterium]